jgi:hypothetical protein
MIDEVNASKKSFIHETPQYRHDQFISQQQKRFSNSKSDGRHPFSQQPSQTYFEDPLVVGSTHKHFGNFLDYNNRAISSETKYLHGGALMYQQPKGGMMSDSDSCSSDEEMGGKSRDELIEMAQGGGVYEDYVKPAGRFLGKVGSEVMNDIIVPIGKELVKDAVKGAVMGSVVGAGKRRGRPKGSKNKSKMVEPPVIEAIHLEHLVKPKKGGMMKSDTIKIKRKPKEEVAHAKDEIANLLSEKARVEGEKKFEEGMIKEAPKKARKPRKKVLKNIEDELHRVEGETKKERAMEAVAKLVESAPPKAKVKRGMTDKAKERAEIVKKVMKEQGLKLGQASKYVKDHGLWQPAKGEWF